MPQQPPPINPDPSIVFGKFAGLVNTVTAERLDPNELARAVNVDLDDRGQLHRRRGYNRKLVGRCHSLYATGGTAYAVVDNWLCLINSNFTTVPLMAGFNDDPLSYTTVGDTVYFSSRSNSGKIVAGEVLPWGENVDHIWLSPVVHPTPTLAEVRGKLLGKPPLAEFTVSSLALPRATHSGLISSPTKLRLRSLHATPVVQLPDVGSKTCSPSSEK